MENNGKGTLMNYGMLAGIIFGGPIASTILQNAGGILGGLAMLKFSRGAEAEADRLGVQYMYAAGYDPTAMATMFEKLAAQNKKKSSSLMKLFSTHPEPVNRRENTLGLIARFPEHDEYVISSSEFQRVKARLLRLSNARAATVVDLDDSGNQRPTLKRRTPDPDGPFSLGRGPWYGRCWVGRYRAVLPSDVMGLSVPDFEEHIAVGAVDLPQYRIAQ